MISAKVQVNGLILGQIGWKYYNQIKKKAMEQEFSFSGLAISLSIAFFIVIAAASILSFTYKNISEKNYQDNLKTNFYQLERSSCNQRFV